MEGRTSAALQPRIPGGFMAVHRSARRVQSHTPQGSSQGSRLLSLPGPACHGGRAPAASRDGAGRGGGRGGGSGHVALPPRGAAAATAAAVGESTGWAERRCRRRRECRGAAPRDRVGAGGVTEGGRGRQTGANVSGSPGAGEGRGRWRCWVGGVMRPTPAFFPSARREAAEPLPGAAVPASRRPGSD